MRKIKIGTRSGRIRTKSRRIKRTKAQKKNYKRHCWRGQGRVRRKKIYMSRKCTVK